MTALRQDLRRKLGVERHGAGGNGVVRIELRIAPSEFDTHVVDVRPDGVIITGGDGLGLIHGLYQALRHLEAALEVERRIDTGKFKGRHRSELNCRTWKCTDFLTMWHALLNDQRWLNLDGLAEGPQPCYAAYKYNPNFPTAYRPDLFLQTER